MAEAAAPDGDLVDLEHKQTPEAEAPQATEAPVETSKARLSMVDAVPDDEDELLMKLQDDAAYDTDLEEAPKKERPDITGVRRGVYLKRCSEVGAHPVGRYVKRPADRKLRLSHRCMSAKEADAITYALELSPDVADLNMRDNRLGPEGFDFVNCLLKDNVHLYKLNISGNALGREGMAQLKSALLRNNTISALDASGNDFDERTGQDWKEILLANDRLSQLNLSHNQLGSDGATALAEGISANDSLCNLNLSWNCIRLKGAVELAKAIRVNKSLRELHLQFNGFSSEGALEVAASLLENRTLRLLDLSGNRIWRQAAGPFARALKKNKKLRVLRLRTNPLLNDGVMEILKVLHAEEQISLEMLDVEDITVTQELMSLYRSIRANNPKFRIRIRTVIKRDGTVERVRDEFSTENPLEVLLMFMQEKNLRLIDLFKNLDKDQSNSISRDEFVIGLRDFEVPLTEDQIDQLIDTLDKDGDGEIDLAEILNINKEFRDVKRRAIHRVRQRRATVRVRDAEIAARAITRLQTLAAASSSFTEEHHSCSSESDGEAAPGLPPPAQLRQRSGGGGGGILRRPSTAAGPAGKVLPNIWSGSNYQLQQKQQQQQRKKQPETPASAGGSKSLRFAAAAGEGGNPAAAAGAGTPTRRRTSVLSSAVRQRRESQQRQQEQNKSWLPTSKSLGKPQSKRN
ncbi:hypothetical protein BOX15_Mlig016904g1 [Macrostomum lignano]|uniref:EF-hand domain-containing protein n=1 Tax=Macrostomum lignano TaxID=282301 RepID=A0A267GXM4_9PLAT|nr:hypothetical protein BOX15_Mlig016904g1 [Macrostomum lignano]